MAEALPTCVNHPGVATRVSCSSCGAPICPRCMHAGPVGQKCPTCAQLPRRARALGKPSHYAKGVVAGLATAVAAGVALAMLLSALRFGALILSAAAGYAVGRAVSWGVQRQTAQPFVVIAGACGVVAIAVAFWFGRGTLLPGNPLLLAAYVLAAWFAVRGLAAR